MSKVTKLLVAICMLSLLPTLVLAQSNNRDDSKYLAGAVPEVDGKVVFTKEFSIPGMSQDEIFQRLNAWMETHMKKNENTSRVVFADKEKGQVVSLGDEWIIFSSSALSLDRTRILYQMAAFCEPEKCNIEISKIRFIYQEGKERFTAEEWIVDEYTLNKDKTKLIRGLAKWRRKSVDFMDDMFKEATEALSATSVAAISDSDKEEVKAEEKKQEGPVVIAPKKEVVAATPAVVATPVVVSTPEKPAIVEQPVVKAEPVANSAIPGYKEVNPAELPTNAIQMGTGKLVIVIGKDAFNMTMMTANAGGSLGKMNEKAVVFTMLTPDQPYQQLETAETYVVRFYPNGQEQPSVVLECKKLPSQTPLEGQPRMYIGEITKAYTK